MRKNCGRNIINIGLYEQITIHISISLEESFLGCKRFISIKGTSQEFDIPAGIEDKQLLLFKNNDNSVKLLISVIPKKNYNRIGQDLLIDHEIDFFDAILGGYTTINCIGELIKIKIKENTKPNSKVKISNKGFMHYMNNEWRGDIIITYKYNIPDFTTEKEKDLFKLLKDESKGNNN
jgi:DnaJ-class molecular chaperone